MNKTVAMVFVMATMLISSVFGATTLDFSSVNGNTASNVNPGSSVNFDFVVTNNGPNDASNVQVTFTPLTDGTNQITGAGTSFSQATLLNGANTGTLTRSVSIPTNQKTGTYTSTFSATASGSTPVTNDTFVLSVQVARLPSVTVTTAVQDLVQGLQRKISFTIQNTGNADLSLNYNLAQSAVTGAPSGLLGPSGNTIVPSAASGVVSVPFGQTTVLELIFNVPSAQVVGAYSGVLSLVDSVSSQQLASQSVSANVRAPVRSVSFGNTLNLSLERQTTTTRTVTVTNNGDLTLTNVVVAQTINAKYTPTLSATTLGTLAPGASASVQLAVTTPDDEDSGSKVLGQFQVTADGSFSQLANVVGQAVTKLEISEVEIQLEGENRDNVDDDETVKDVKPLSDVTIFVTVENLFATDNEIEVNELTVNILNIDDSDDIELESDGFEVRDGKDNTEKLEFTIPESVSHEEEYDVEIFVEGEDENGATHTDTFRFKLQVDKEKHQFLFENQVTPSVLTACTGTYTVDVSFVNLGREDEDDVVFHMTNDDLGIRIEEDVGDMTTDFEDDEYRFQKFYTFRMPSDAEQGKYVLVQEVFIEEDELEERNELVLDVQECSAPSEDDDEDLPLPVFDDEDTTPPKGGKDDAVVVVTTPSGDEVVPVGSAPTGTDVVTATPVDSSDAGNFRGSPLYVVLLIVGNLAVIAILLALIARVLKKN